MLQQFLNFKNGRTNSHLIIFSLISQVLLQAIMHHHHRQWEWVCLQRRTRIGKWGTACLVEDFFPLLSEIHLALVGWVKIPFLTTCRDGLVLHFLVWMLSNNSNRQLQQSQQYHHRHNHHHHQCRLHQFSLHHHLKVGTSYPLPLLSHHQDRIC